MLILVTQYLRNLCYSAPTFHLLDYFVERELKNLIYISTKRPELFHDLIFSCIFFDFLDLQLFYCGTAHGILKSLFGRHLCQWLHIKIALNFSQQL
jgi:hypothetical protein